MNMNKIFPLSIGLGVLPLCTYAGHSNAEKSNPNVIILNVDDLGYGDIGCYGATKVKTPNIDRLAAEGRSFLDAHSSSAVSSPSRYGLITGEYPCRNDMWAPIF